MTLDLLDLVSLIVTAVMVPVVTLVVWIVKKLIQATLDHTAELTRRFDKLSVSIDTLTQVVTDYLKNHKHE